MKLSRNTTALSFVGVIAATMLLSSCAEPENSPGYEYMPDMYRSPAIEAYVDYGMDPYHFGDSMAVAQRNTMSARLPVAGTIPFSEDPAKAQFNFPYGYAESDYELAGSNLKNPVALTQANFDEGKVLYKKFCTPCHGAKGKGDGLVVSNGGHPPPPAYDSPQLKNLPGGKIFHSITYGKNLMGAHAQQINKEERWKLVHYVQSLQSGKDPFAGGENAEPAVTETSAEEGQIEEVIETESETE